MECTMNAKPKVCVAMIGARMHYAVPRLLHEAGLLDRFFTDGYIGNKPWLETALRAVPDVFRLEWFQRWLGRKDAKLPSKRVTSFDLLGLRIALALRNVRTDADRERIFAETNGQFAKSVLRHGFGFANTVWGFNTASLELFRAAKARGLRCILEQTILPRTLERQLLAQVGAEWPDWQPGFHEGIGQGRLAEREKAEWELADQIVAGSDFVMQGLIQCGVPKEKIHVIPYGVDQSRFGPTRGNTGGDGPLRVLFVGEVGLRKGAPYLLEALRRIGRDQVEARFVGRIALDPSKLATYSGIAQFVGPVPRTEMPEQYRWAQLFVLPSIVEGSAVATYEALMSGLPVVATPNTGTIVTHGQNGIIVPARDIDALTSAIKMYCRDRVLLEINKKFSKENFYKIDVKRYGHDICKLINIDND
jgi:glycosyltransferase involved in cell wall biosynthesis